jgi:arylsulfatase A-like enzyme
MADFIGKLKSSGRYDDALIILTGDHGEEFQEHGNWFHCSALSPQQTRVPLLIKWPKAMGRGPALRCASHLDVAPTLLDLLGCPREGWKNLPGRSLLRTPTGEPSLVLATHFASRDGEGLLLRRGARVAAFGWPKLWEAGVPDTLWLERTVNVGSQNDVATLKAAFPDIFDKVFSKLQPASGR